MTQLPALTADLAARIRAAGFRPGLVACIETGGRLPAAALALEFGVPLLPIVVRRRGHGLKKTLAPIIARLPRHLTNMLRLWEERSGLHARGGRIVRWPRPDGWAGKQVLVVDDAADTGGTLRAVRTGLAARGVAAGDLRTAVLGATTAEGQAEADFFVLHQNCVLPWSPDSVERAQAEALMAQVRFSAL